MPLHAWLQNGNLKTGEFKQFFFPHSLTLMITAVSGDLDGTLYQILELEKGWAV